MKIQVVSDLHLEFGDINIANAGDTDVLILSGDIMVAEDLHQHPPVTNTVDQMAIAQGTGMGRKQQAAQAYRNFLKRVSFQFPHVIYVAGNHEFYHGRFYDSLKHLREECSRFPNIYFLEQDTKIIDDVMFVGGTLWTDCNKGDPLTQHALSDMMNDYRVVRNDQLGFTKLRPIHTIERHDRTMEYFKLIIDNAKSNHKIVVVGHHAPTHVSIDPRYRDDYIMNGGYASDLSEFILDRPEIVLWTHGHTHTAQDYMVGATRVVCNPRGYEGHEEHSGWDPLKVIEL